MPNNRRVKLVITAIADGGNFGTGESNGEVYNMTIKVGITGTHSAGKTTFANKLEKKYLKFGKTVILIDEVARKCPYALGTTFAQEYIYRTQMMREKHAMRQDVDVIITDRTTLDNLTYYWAIIEDIDNPHDRETYFVRWQTLYQEAKEWMSSYNQVIRLPLNLEYLKADDPIRSKDVGYARRIDKLFDRFVDPFVTHRGEPCTPLNSISHIV